jgi:tRNA pseudouridine13 synthase
VSRVRLTADLPGAGGRIKDEPRDFEVEERPAYLPSGEGEHLYLWIEKVNLTTEQAARRLAAALSVPARDVGWAGLKDRRAVTRQLLSVPASAEGRLGGLSVEGVRVLWAKRHGNKLRTGHLKGNRFRIRVREVRDAGAARAALERLGALGVPNFFGEQRFGRERRNAALGKRLIQGLRLDRAPGRFERKLYLSAFQSELFNRALERRLLAGTFATALAGDVMRKEDTGGLFVCQDPEVDQARIQAWEIAPAGPLYGPELALAGGPVREAEDRLLQEEGLTLEDFRRGGGETRGGRRAYRVRLGEPSLEAAGPDLWLQFDLPRGSYATVVLDEIMKTTTDGLDQGAT